MRTVSVPPQATDVNALLEQARHEDILVRASDGAEFMVALVDQFDEEIARTRKNARLMMLLEERAKQTKTIPLAEVKRQLRLDG